MTAILAVPSKDRVYVGHDSAITMENGQQLICGTKAIWIGKFLVAVAGEIGGHWEALQLESPKTVREVCDLLGPGPEAEVVIAQRNAIWQASWVASESRWSICEVAGPVALGNGGLCALGGFTAAKGTVPKRILRGLEAAGQCVQGVGGPYFVHSTLTSRKKGASSEI